MKRQIWKRVCSASEKDQKKAETSLNLLKEADMLFPGECINQDGTSVTIKTVFCLQKRHGFKTAV